ncbi:hypothetical protein QTN47_08605 [Danxiaibacter flavus]|uniref:Uncharacterized protein n=1 Tax=Danxiaibacter flavus TaxID=3049108 RepID=A0ABV3ZCF9_9BACT|nr:hypothetical protein QNM32_08605 [Chitinophagaceae bacterium DXS]
MKKRKPSLRIRTASNDCLPYEKKFKLLISRKLALPQKSDAQVAINKLVNYFLVAVSTLAAVSTLVVSGAGVTGAAVAVSAFTAEESVVVVDDSPEPHAAKAPIANTNNSFFIFVECFCE